MASLIPSSTPNATRFTRRAGDEPIAGYRLLGPLGAGGFGEVWKCEAPGGVLKALKIITLPPLRERTSGETPAERELAAIERIKHIRHPFLLSLDRVELVGGELFVVMELADSSLLHEYESYCRAGHEGIPDDRLLRHLLETAEILDVLHLQYGLQHLDVKPGNLLTCSSHVKLADFGLVSTLQSLAEEQERSLMGCFTPRYAAVEMLQGTISTACDQYSLAIVYQELLTGTVPFEGNSLLKRLVSPPELESLPEADRPIVARALAPEPKDRFPSCLDFIRELIAVRGEAVYVRLLSLDSLSAKIPEFSADNLPEIGDDQTIRVKEAGPQKSGDHTAFYSRPDAADTMQVAHDGNADVDTPNHTVEQRLDEAPAPAVEEDSPDVIYPLTIHISDLRWKPDPDGESAPKLHDFIDQLVVSETGQTLAQMSSSGFRNAVGDTIEQTYVIPALSKLSMRQTFGMIVRQWGAEVLSFTNNGIVFAVEGAVPLWKLFRSKQRVLKVTIEIGESGYEQSELRQASVRIEPLNPNGPPLDPAMHDVRLLLLKNIASILQATPERRGGDRWPCSFGVVLYPVLRDWRFGPEVEARAVNLSITGIGLMASAPPLTKRFYLRVGPSNPLNEYAILIDVVRHRPLTGGTYSWGAILGRG